MPLRQGFPRGRRLRKRRQFLIVRAEGRRFSGRHFLVTVRLHPGAPDAGISPVAARPRFGITVTRKVGDAVTRNRIKRWVREACRRAGDLFPPQVDVVIVARPAAATAGAAETLADLTEVARRIPRGRPSRAC